MQRREACQRLARCVNLYAEKRQKNAMGEKKRFEQIELDDETMTRAGRWGLGAIVACTMGLAVGVGTAWVLGLVVYAGLVNTWLPEVRRERIWEDIKASGLGAAVLLGIVLADTLMQPELARLFTGARSTWLLGYVPVVTVVSGTLHPEREAPVEKPK